MNIQIGTHTDSRGSSISNLKLSEHRAKSIKSELVNKFGISPKRITIKGYGESKLLIKDADIERAHSNQQKEKLHQLNRRTDRKSTRLNSSHVRISYAVFCLK